MIAIAILVHALTVLAVGRDLSHTLRQPKHWKPTIYWEN